MTHRIDFEVFSSVIEHDWQMNFGKWSRDFIAECNLAGLHTLPDTFGITVGLPNDNSQQSDGCLACESPVVVTDCADDIFTAFKRYNKTASTTICTLFFASKVWSDKPFIEIHLIDDNVKFGRSMIVKWFQSIFD